MAMTYQNFASLGVNLNRQKYGPLDISSVFTSAADLKYYLTKGAFTEGVSEYWYKNANEKVVPYPYEGQVLATVIDGDTKVYVLRLDAEGNFEAKAIEPEVDGKTIKLTNGKLELVGLPTDTSKVYVPSLVNGVLTWAEPDTSTAEGQQQAIEGLTASVAGLSEVLNGKAADEEAGTEAVVGLVEKVATLEAVDNATQAELDAYKEVVTAAIAAGVKEAKDYADTQDADTVYDDTELAGRVTTVEGKVADLEASVEAIDYVDADELDAAIDEAVYAINETLETKAAQSDLEALEGRVDAFLTGTGATEALDSLQELIKYINEHDDVEISGILADIEAIEGKLAGVEDTVVEYVTGAINALKIGDYAKASDLTTLADRVKTLEEKPFDTYATKSEIEAKGYAVAKDVAETYATKSEVTETVEGIENDLLAYAKTSEVETILEDYYTKSEVYTKNDIDTKIGIPGKPEVTDEEGNVVTEGVAGTGIFANAYSREEIDKLLDEVQGGSSASADSVLRQLNTYKSTNDERVGIIETKNGEQDAAIAAAQTQADKGVADAKKVSDDLATANLAITDNTREIGVVKDSISGLNTTLTEKITALEGKDTAIEGNITALQTTVGGHTTTITEQGIAIKALQDKDTEFAGLIQANTNKFAGYYTKDEADAVINAAIDAIPEVSFDGYATEKYVTDTIAPVTEEVGKKANAADVYTKDQIGTIADGKTIVEMISDAQADATYDDTAVKQDISKNASAIATLVGLVEGDNTKSVRAIAVEEVTKVIDGAPEALNTLKEIADWINDDEAGAAKLAADVVANADAIKAINHEDTGILAIAKAYTESEVAKVSANVSNVSSKVDANVTTLATLVGADKDQSIRAIATSVANDAVANIPMATAQAAGLVKASEEVTVTDGVLGIGQVSTDKLVQGSETIVLNGGSADSANVETE